MISEKRKKINELKKDCKDINEVVNILCKECKESGLDRESSVLISKLKSEYFKNLTAIAALKKGE